MALAVGSSLDPVTAQRGHAPPPRRGLRPVVERTAAFAGRAQLQSIKSSRYGTNIQFGDDPGQSGHSGLLLALAIWVIATNLWTLAAVYGVFYGGWVAILPAVVMDYFGGGNVSGIIRILLHERCVRHPDRAECRRLRLRSQPRLHAPNSG
jgi:hypothetical protein